LRQGLTMQSRLASNSRFSCLSLINAGITGMCYHARLGHVIFYLLHSSLPSSAESGGSPCLGSPHSGFLEIHRTGRKSSRGS
jgi:hypothetical protein